jgi:cell fate regulator YaaT (PSP1 superfamily)
VNKQIKIFTHSQFTYSLIKKKMGCKSCGTGGCGSVKASNNKEKSNHVGGCNNNGACGTGGCNKMNVFDWLSNMDVPSSMRFNVVEVKFKGGRKEYFRNTNDLELYTGDFVVCEMPTGYHIGSVSLQGELVRLQMIKRSVQDDDNLKKILRKASEKEMEKHEQAVNRDLPTMYRVREISHDLKLQMKVSDVEFQSDNSKATFYYSADDRVDFRELIKVLAGEFKIRVEMKQISLRQEAARVGGIGSCGRELCCSTWLTDFKAIPTSAARYQNLSLNPTKLSGQCGRLKCCLNYELETYMDALSDIPTIEKSLKTEKGEATLQKTDIFRKIMWFSYHHDSNWQSLPIPKVLEIIEMNEAGLIPKALDDLSLPDSVLDKLPKNVDLARFDKRFFDKRNQKPNQNQSSPQSKPAQERPQGNQPNQKPIQNQPNRPQNQSNQPNQKPIQNQQSRPQIQGNQPNQNPVQNQPNRPQIQGNQPNQNPVQNQPNRPQSQGNQPNQKPIQNQQNRPQNQGNQPNQKPVQNQPNRPQNQGNQPTQSQQGQQKPQNQNSQPAQTPVENQAENQQQGGKKPNRFWRNNKKK